MTVLNLHEGDFGFIDARGQLMKGNQKLEAELTIRAGDVVWDLNGLAAPRWDEVPIEPLQFDSLQTGNSDK